MFRPTSPSPGSRQRPRAVLAAALALSLVVAACSSDGATTSAPGTEDSTGTTEASSDTAPADTAPADTEPADTASSDTAPSDTAPGSSEPADTDVDFASAFPDLGPPTGEPITIGLVNTEGTPGLDFPDIREDITGAVEYLNEHGGLGGRPIDLVNCKAQGSPETSQACAQELVGKEVELVLLGLDLFPDYNTYTAADVPVVGVVPILPGDYTANALFLTGGNATVGAAMAAVAKDHFGAQTVGIVSSDNPGANASEAALTASLDIVTGPALYTYLEETTGLTLWPGDLVIDCGYSEAYPAICSFTFPFAEYRAGGAVETIPGLEAVSSAAYLP